MQSDLDKMQSELLHQGHLIEDLKESQEKMSEHFDAKFDKVAEQMTRIEKQISKWDGAHWGVAIMLTAFLLFIGWTFNRIDADYRDENIHQSQDILQNSKDIQNLKIEIKSKK